MHRPFRFCYLFVCSEIDITADPKCRLRLVGPSGRWLGRGEGRGLTHIRWRVRRRYPLIHIRHTLSRRRPYPLINTSFRFVCESRIPVSCRGFRSYLFLYLLRFRQQTPGNIVSTLRPFISLCIIPTGIRRKHYFPRRNLFDRSPYNYNGFTTLWLLFRSSFVYAYTLKRFFFLNAPNTVRQ